MMGRVKSPEVMNSRIDNIRTTLQALIGLEVRFPILFEPTADRLADDYFMFLVDTAIRDLLEKEGLIVEAGKEPREISGNRLRWCSLEARTRIYIEVERMTNNLTRLSWGTRFGEYKVYAEAKKVTSPSGTAVSYTHLTLPTNREV